MPLRNRKKKRQPKPPSLTERVNRIETLLEACQTKGLHHSLPARLDDQDLAIETLESELAQALAENVVLDSKVEKLLIALGGVLWSNQTGVLRPIALLSTGHLKNILAGGIASLNTRLLVSYELKRREVDRRYRSLWRRIGRAISSLFNLSPSVVEHIEEEPLPPGGYPPVEPGNIHPGVRKAKRLKRK
jgi:hypothetical protein